MASFGSELKVSKPLYLKNLNVFSLYSWPGLCFLKRVMRPIHVSVIAGLSLATLGVTQAGFIEGELQGELHGGVSTGYIWRGVDQRGGSMIEAGVDFSGFSFFGFDYHSSLWYASIGNDGNGHHSFDEVDYETGLSRDLGFATLGIGQILYNFPGGYTPYSSAQEVYFTASRTQWDFDFALTYFWDIDEDNDGYSEFTVDRSFALSECLALATGGTLSYDWETTDLHHIGLTAALNWAINDVLTVSPYVSATWAQDGAKGGTALGRYGQGDELFGGIILSASF